MRVYDPAKTMPDCSEFRGTVTVDVAIAALRACVVQRLSLVDEFTVYSRTVALRR